jgi:hypothetical protein
MLAPSISSFMAPLLRWAVPRPFRQLATDQVDKGRQSAKEKDERREVRCEFAQSVTVDHVALHSSLALRNTTAEQIRWNVVRLEIHYGISSMGSGSAGGPIQAGGGAATGIIEPGATELQPLDELTIRRETHSLRLDVIVHYGPNGVESELREKVYVEFEQLPRSEFPTVAFQTRLT